MEKMKNLERITISSMKLKEENGSEIRRACFRLQKEIEESSGIKVGLDLRETIKFGEKLSQGLEQSDGVIVVGSTEAS